MAFPPPVFYDRSRHQHILPQVAQIHADCVLHDNQLATFLPDKEGRMDHAKLLSYWEKKTADIASGLRFFVVQFTDDMER
jgi:hypothetical protein